jgi:cytochrome P450
MPWLDRFFKKTLGNRLGSGPFGLYVRDRVQQRLQNKQPDTDASKPDLIGHFASAQEKYPDIMTDGQIGVLSAGNLFAGSQSPSHVLDTICNFLATSPPGQRRLYQELTDVKCTYPATLQQIQSLPYLDGVIREGYRLHGVGFFILERVTPAGGLRLPSGQHLPAGIKVGMSSHGLSRREDVFGYDADEFKPDRWMRRGGESVEAFAKRRLVMERCDMTFGYGSRVCIGKNIATMELYKAVATLVGLFEVSSSGIGTDPVLLILLTLHSPLVRPCWDAKDVRGQRACLEEDRTASMSPFRMRSRIQNLTRLMIAAKPIAT